MSTPTKPPLHIQAHAPYALDQNLVYEYHGLLLAVGWEPRAISHFAAALGASLQIVTAYDELALVGALRVVGDGRYTAYLCDLVTAPTYQQRGLAAAMVDAIELPCDHLECIADDASTGFYLRTGWSLRPGMWKVVS